MAKDIVVDAEPRTERGKSAVRRMRAEGRLPGVIYGRDVSATIHVDRLGLLKMLHAHGSHPLVTVKLNGDDYLALVKELQIDPVRRQAVHVDFFRVQEDQAVQTEVDVQLVGEPLGVKEGGILQVQLSSVLIEALPRELPEHIDADVSALEMGDVLRVGDITVPPGVRIVTDSDETVATITAPRVEEEPVAAVLEGEEAELEAAAADGEEADGEGESSDDAGGDD